MASTPEEVNALDARYNSSYANAKSIGKELELLRFEDHVSKSSACKAMPRWELERLMSSDSATAATYYQQISGRSRIPDTNHWNRLRRIADAAFFSGIAEEIHFAALSTNERWLSNYGDGAVFFKEEMIAHRATLFETNTAVWIAQNNGDLHIPPGYRAIWDRRRFLAVAKLGDAVCEKTQDASSLLLSCGSTSDDDSFIEVHICGGFTIRSTSEVIIRQGALTDLGRENVLDRAKALGITFKELP